MTNNRYTDNIADLDIDITAPEGWELLLYNTNDYHKLEFKRKIGNSRIVLVSYYNNCGTRCIHPGQIYCFAPKDYEFGQKICQSAARTKGYSTDTGRRWVF